MSIKMKKAKEILEQEKETISAKKMARKIKKAKRLNKSSLKKMIPEKSNIECVSTLSPGQAFAFAFNTDKRGRLIRITPSGATVDIEYDEQYIKEDSKGEEHKAIRRRRETYTISRQSEVYRLRERKKSGTSTGSKTKRKRKAS